MCCGLTIVLGSLKGDHSSSLNADISLPTHKPTINLHGGREKGGEVRSSIKVVN